jgi:3-hydroxybutyryl-CoA dehydrogenase
MKFNVLGMGVMGRQIAVLMYLAGCEVYLWDIDGGLEENFIGEIGRLKKRLKGCVEGKYFFVKNLENLEDNCTVEAVVEDLQIKKDLYSELKSKITKTYFTNTSSYLSKEIDENVYGLHFFNPIGLIKLVEVCCPKEIDLKTILGKFHDFLIENEYEIINVNSNRGYLANYLLFNEISTVFKAIEGNCYSVSDMQTVYDILYSKRDIFKIIDVVGIDVTYKILMNLKEEDDSIYIPKSLEKALTQNIFGKKNNTSIKSVL